jgi:hypothetical protein
VERRAWNSIHKEYDEWLESLSDNEVEEFNGRIDKTLIAEGFLEPGSSMQEISLTPEEGDRATIAVAKVYLAMKQEKESSG